MTPHVSTSVNRSPTRIGVRSAFHQQRIGSDSTSPGAGRSLGLCATAGAGGARRPRDHERDDAAMRQIIGLP